MGTSRKTSRRTTSTIIPNSQWQYHNFTQLAEYEGRVIEVKLAEIVHGHVQRKLEEENQRHEEHDRPTETTGHVQHEEGITQRRVLWSAKKSFGTKNNAHRYVTHTTKKAGKGFRV